MRTDGLKGGVDSFWAEDDFTLMVGQPSRGISGTPWLLLLDLAGTPLTHRSSGVRCNCEWKPTNTKVDTES